MPCRRSSASSVTSYIDPQTSTDLLETPGIAAGGFLLSEFLSRHVRHQPCIDLVRRHVGWYPSGVPGPTHRGVLRPDPDLFADFQVAEIDIPIRQNDDHPFVDVDHDLLPGFDGSARPSFELAVVRLAPPDVRMAGLYPDA